MPTVKRLFALITLVWIIALIGPLPVLATWSQQQKITASDAGELAEFGESVDISGDKAIVGAPQANAAYIFTRSGTTWTEQQKLTVSGTSRFGDAVAIDGNYAVIGAPSSTGGVGNLAGAAYIFFWNGSTWVEQDQLEASGLTAGDQFGSSVDISGDYAIVGGPFYPANSKGGAWIYNRSLTVWSEQTRVLASDGVDYDRFGVAVAISATYAIVGAWGANAAYSYTLVDNTWTNEQKLTPGDAVTDRYGSAVSTDGTYAIVGNNQTNIAGNGAAYVYTVSGGTWGSEQKLTASNGAASDGFGYSVVVDTTVAVIGAPYTDGAGAGSNSGSIYIFTQSGGTFSQSTELTADDAATDDNFGFSASIDDSYAIGGTQQKDVQTGAGYVFYDTPAVPEFSPLIGLLTVTAMFGMIYWWKLQPIRI